ncbi:MAG: hypothetical protein JSV85_00145 [Candidatus Bathyarchaeota archaeon]|nr:MAG: hypothetical protein JSV85_00145 [Candidatus Bathyarchaeota archaeon]
MRVKTCLSMALVMLLLLMTLAIPLNKVSGNMVALIVDENFDDVTLGPEWIVDPGRGDFSLTANPGHLRYIIDAYHTSFWGTGGYARTLHLVRPFSGDQWVLKAVIIYNMRPGSPTNNRNMHFVLFTPDYSSSLWMVLRSVGVYDGNPGSNAIYLAGSSPIYFPNSPNPLPIERWYFEIERDRDYFIVRASNDGDDSTFEYQGETAFSPGLWGNDQQIVISGGGWYGSNSPPGWADFDFIRVAPTATSIPAAIDTDPNTLNLKSKGRWVTCYIELPEGHNGEDIDVSSIRLNETFSVDPTAPTQIGDYDSDGIPDLMVKFNRTELTSYLYNIIEARLDTVALNVSGQLTDGTVFEGIDIVRTRLVGDVNEDCVVDVTDLSLVGKSFGARIDEEAHEKRLDLTSDGVVDVLDLMLIGINYGATILG